jgi:DNA-binding transcriptional regulator YiaG
MAIKSKSRTLSRTRPGRDAEHDLVADVRKRFGVSQSELARLTGHSLRSIVSWESGAAPNKAAVQRLRELKRFQQALACIVRPRAIPRWLNTPNDAFGGLKPLEVIERGEIDRLWRMIIDLGTGIPG